MLIFLNAFVLYFHLEHAQRISFCRCFLIFNPAVFCVNDGVILWLKIKNPTATSIKLKRSEAKFKRKNSETRATPKGVWIRRMHSASVAFS